VLFGSLSLRLSGGVSRTDNGDPLYTLIQDYLLPLAVIHGLVTVRGGPQTPPGGVGPSGGHRDLYGGAAAAQRRADSRARPAFRGGCHGPKGAPPPPGRRCAGVPRPPPGGGWALGGAPRSVWGRGGRAKTRRFAGASSLSGGVSRTEGGPAGVPRPPPGGGWALGGAPRSVWGMTSHITEQRPSLGYFRPCTAPPAPTVTLITVRTRITSTAPLAVSTGMAWR
jgi:hypothetical protein